MKTVLVSSCLLGVACRWHGNAVRPSYFVKKFIRQNPGVKIIPVCPEEMGGLPTPRPPAKRRKDRVYETCADKTKRNNVTGREITAEFRAGAEAVLDIARENDCKMAILCKWSPSCDRQGITGRLLIENGVEVVNVF